MREGGRVGGEEVGKEGGRERGERKSEMGGGGGLETNEPFKKFQRM